MTGSGEGEGGEGGGRGEGLGVGWEAGEPRGDFDMGAAALQNAPACLELNGVGRVGAQRGEEDEEVDEVHVLVVRAKDERFDDNGSIFCRGRHD